MDDVVEVPRGEIVRHVVVAALSVPRLGEHLRKRQRRCMLAQPRDLYAQLSGGVSGGQLANAECTLHLDDCRDRVRAAWENAMNDDVVHSSPGEGGDDLPR